MTTRISAVEAAGTGRGYAREPLWTRDYALTVASLHLFFLSWAMLFATLPLFLDDARKWQVGWVVGGAFGAISLVTRPFSGRFTDRVGRRPVMLWGALLAGAALAAHGLTNDPLLLTPLRFAYGAGSCLYTTAALAALADALPASRRGEGMGWYGVIYTLTNVYGPWLGQRLGDQTGLKVFFVLAGAVTVSSGVAALGLRARPRPAEDRRGHLISRAALLPTGTFMALTMAFSVLPAFLALYVKHEGIGTAGLFFLFNGMALVPARWFGGTLADRWGRPAVIFPGLFLSAVGMAMLAAVNSAALLYLAAVVFGVGFGFGHTGLTILTVDRALPEERGAAMATFALAWDIGTLGSFALGFAGDAIGYAAIFATAAVLPLIAAAGFQVARGRERGPAGG